MLRALLAAAAAAGAAAFSPCTFCALNEGRQAVNYDLGTLPAGSWSSSEYTVTSPCGQSTTPACGAQSDPMTQSCKGLGNLTDFSVGIMANGFNLTLRGGFDDPPMANGRNAVYIFVCDTTVPASNPPDIANLTERPGGFYNVVWRHPAACPIIGGAACGPPPPVPPPVPPPTPPMPPPVPPPVPP